MTRIARVLLDGVARNGVVSDRGDAVCVLDGDDHDIFAALALASTGLSSELEAGASGQWIPLGEAQLLCPVPFVGKYLAVGLNYFDHTKESGMIRPDVPIVFTKQRSCIAGPFDAVERPLVSKFLDYEGELAVVIGRRARHVPVERAGEVIGGYLVANDVSVRDWQGASPTMTMGKSFDTHGPLGPWITTADDVPDPQNLHIRTWVNGEVRQDGNTRDMLSSIAEIIAYISTAVTLEPGDVIATGTPAGIGHAMTPPRYLAEGDVVRVEIGSLGAIENRIVDEASASPRISHAPVRRGSHV